ncbi:MAG: SDR family oxidoreductase, partial [Candidatus Omnitrophica bacterium]|nr:SDR family oxidoreductase [Candidatus Omnitrophota bacterium]
MKRQVLITGASRGLGLSLLRRFVACGDHVVAVSRTKKHWKEAHALRGPGRVTLIEADLRSEPAVKRLAQKAARLSQPLDILINNAGIGGELKLLTDLALKDFEEMMSANLTSAFLMCKHFVPVFRRQGRAGLIVNVSSMAGIRAVPKLFAYSASKYGMLALTQCAAKENADADLKCITVCPGGMNTQMRASLFGQKDSSAQQSPDFVAGVMMDIIDNRFPVATGSDVVIRHGKIFSVTAMP